MGKLIDFNSKRELVEMNNGFVTSVPRTREEYLEVIRNTLIVEDYYDICIGILDYNHYKNIEPQLQKIVDSYYNNFNA